VPDLLFHGLLFDLETGFVATKHVPDHPVGAGTIKLLIPVVEKIVNA